MKRQKRELSKKKKMTALANMIRINEMDKQQALQSTEIALADESSTLEPWVKKIKTETQLYSVEMISDEQYKQLRIDLAILRNPLEFYLNFVGDQATLATKAKSRKPLFFEDIQNLLMRAALKHCSPVRPNRWCVLENPSRISHTVIIVIDGPTAYNFSSNQSCFTNANAIFKHKLEVVLPFNRGQVVKELLLIPWLHSNKETLIRKYDSLEAALMLNKNPTAATGQFFSIDNDIDPAPAVGNGTKDAFPRTGLLLSPLQMIVEGYPMPSKNDKRYRDFRPTKSHYKPVTCSSQMFGLDCEMVRSVKADNELARVSIVDENCASVYETLVRPECKVIDCLTQWSGITWRMLKTATKTLKEVQDDVCKLLPPDAILVGQSLNCDLNAMKLFHPYVIDTSVIFNLTGYRNKKSKLQQLSKHFLGEDIQMGKAGHSSIEDSTACIKLAKLKLSKGIYYGDAVLQSKQVHSEKKNKLVAETPTSTQKPEKILKSTLVTTNKNSTEFGNFFNASCKVEQHKTVSAKQAVQVVRKTAADSDFCLAHINMLDEIGHSADDGGSADDDKKISKHVPLIDKWIYKVWRKMNTNGMLMVIFGGREGSNSNGLAMVEIKS